MTRITAVLLSLAWISIPAMSANAQQSSSCALQGSLARLPGLPEASGLAISRRLDGLLWTHNDSAQPVLFALDRSGALQGQLRINGAAVENWEAIAVGPCGESSCIYVADIGDNRATRRRITVYRVPEPESASGAADVSGVFHATYPDGAHDAEALLAANGRLYIVTKGETGPVAAYAFPANMQAETPMTLQRVSQIASTVNARARITDASVSPDGKWVVLRSTSTLTFYDGPEFLAGKVRAVSTVDLSALKEPQGEGVALGPNHTVYLTGEGGGKGQAGTFAQLACTLPGG